MIKKIILSMVVLSAVSCFGQGGLTRIQRFCEVGGRKIVTQGLNSTNNAQESFPQCQVSVYAHGTQTLSNIFLDNLSVPTPMANPFTADTNGKLGFYAGPGCYDIVTSGGLPNDQFPQPFTYADVCIQQGSGGGANIQCPNALNGSMAAWIDPNNLGCDIQAGTDFVGDVFGQSFRALGPSNGFIGLEGGSIDPVLNESNFVYFIGADTVPFPYVNKVPGLQGSIGNAIGIINQIGPLNYLGWLNIAGGFPEFQVNGVDLLNCTGISCPKQNLIQGSGITIANGSAGDVTISAAGGSNPCPTASIGTQIQIWVDPAGNDSTGNGSNGNPYQHITRALQDIPQIVCQPYTIQLKSVGSYDVGQNHPVSINSRVFYSGGFPGYQGSTGQLGGQNWPYQENDPTFTFEYGSWIEIVGTPNPGDATGTPGDGSNPDDYVLTRGSSCDGNPDVDVSYGFLALRGLSLQGAGWGLLASHSTVELAGVTLHGNCTDIDAGSTYFWFDKNNSSQSQWCNVPNNRGSSFCVYFDASNATNFNVFLHENSVFTDRTADFDFIGNSHAGLEISGTGRGWFLYHSQIFLDGALDSSSSHARILTLDNGSTLYGLSFSFDSTLEGGVGAGLTVLDGSSATCQCRFWFENDTDPNVPPVEINTGGRIQGDVESLDISQLFTNVSTPYLSGPASNGATVNLNALGTGGLFLSSAIASTNILKVETGGSSVGHLFRVCGLATTISDGVANGSVDVKVQYTDQRGGAQDVSVVSGPLSWNVGANESASNCVVIQVGLGELVSYHSVFVGSHAGYDAQLSVEVLH